MKTPIICVLAFSTLLLAGCSTYLAPGPKADLQAFVAPGLEDGFAAKPTNPFPASIATVRVQAPGYTNYYLQRNGGTHGGGRYSVITAREVEDQSEFDRVTRLPQVAGVVALNRLLLPEHLDGERDIRQAASRLQADLVLLYTFDTFFYNVDRAKPLTVITLGLSPTRKITAMTNASGLLIDTRTGYIYSAYQASQRAETYSTSWNSRDSADEVRRSTEKAAFKKLVDEFESSWPRLLARSR